MTFKMIGCSAQLVNNVTLSGQGATFEELEAMLTEEFENFKNYGGYWAPIKKSYAGSDE